MSQGFKNITELIDAEVNGQTSIFMFRKTPSQATVTGLWFDMSMSPGNPIPQYYIGAIATATPLKHSTDGGLYHSKAVSPQKKFLRKTTLMSNSATGLPAMFLLLDYLIFYPFIDEGTTDEQFMDNTQTLPRYTDGAGVKIMAVSVAGRTGGQSFVVSYTNQDGVSGRTTVAALENTAASNGQIVTSQVNANAPSGPFLTLQSGDTGVRSIESVTMLGADVGLFSLVLVKPLAQTQIRGVDAPVEVDHFTDKANLVEIKDDAYLNWIVSPRGSLSGVSIFGDIRVVWN